MPEIQNSSGNVYSGTIAPGKKPAATNTEVKTEETSVKEEPKSPELRAKENEAIRAKFGTGIQRNLPSPKLIPTEKEKITLIGKDGTRYMAREAKLPTGTPIMVVSKKTEPSRGMLMGKEDFFKNFIQETLPDVTPKQIGDEKKNLDAIKTDVNCTQSETKRTISGESDGKKFELTHFANFSGTDSVTGIIGDKPVKMSFENDGAGFNYTGTVGNETADFRITHSPQGFAVLGHFKSKDVNINIIPKNDGYSAESENMTLMFKNKNMLGNNIEITGNCKEDPDLVPILTNAVYTLVSILQTEQTVKSKTFA